MKDYARIQNNLVMEIILGFSTTEDDRPKAPLVEEGAELTEVQLEQQRFHDEFAPGEVPIEQRFTPEIVATLVAIPAGKTIAQGDSYNGSTFGPAPALPAPPVPAQVTMRQARLALLGAGKLSAVDAAIASLPSPQKEEAQIEWSFSSTVERDSKIVALLGPALALSDSDLDALFAAAAQL